MERGRVVVTGASTGIGEATALELDRLGYRVFAGVRKTKDAEALRRKGSGRLQPLMLDVTDAQSIAEAARTVAEAVGKAGLSGLVNNAGIAVGGPLEFLPIEELREQLEVNVVGPVAVAQAFLPLLRRGRGRIVNIGSMSGRVAAPFLGPYAASKFALEALTAAMRMELKPWGIHVSLVGPGAIKTPIWTKSLAEADRMRKALPPEANRLYGAQMDWVYRHAAKAGEHGIDPAAVVRAVVHALTAPRPRTRYVVGKDAWLGEIARLLPDGLRERIILRHMRLEGR